jgi:hypothetical protein
MKKGEARGVVLLGYFRRSQSLPLFLLVHPEQWERPVRHFTARDSRIGPFLELLRRQLRCFCGCRPLNS